MPKPVDPAAMPTLPPSSPRGNDRLDPELLRGALELRALLAPSIARLAAERMGEDAHGRLLTLVARMEQAQGDLPELSRLAMDLWGALVAGTDNRALVVAFDSLAGVYGEMLDGLSEVLAVEHASVRDYVTLARAVIGREPERAAWAAALIVSRGTNAMQGAIGRVELVAREGVAR